MATIYKVLGVNDEVTTCECCGRTNLKKTVALTDGMKVVRFGTECAATAMGFSKLQVEKEIRTAAREQEATATMERNRKNAEWWTRYNSWLMTNYGDTKSDLVRVRRYRAETGDIN